MNSRHLLLVSIEIGECQGLIVWIQDFGENGLVALFELRQGWIYCLWSLHKRLRTAVLNILNVLLQKNRTLIHLTCHSWSLHFVGRLDRCFHRILRDLYKANLLNWALDLSIIFLNLWTLIIIIFKTILVVLLFLLPQSQSTSAAAHFITFSRSHPRWRPFWLTFLWTNKRLFSFIIVFIAWFRRLSLRYDILILDLLLRNKRLRIVWQLVFVSTT